MNLNNMAWSDPVGPKMEERRPKKVEELGDMEIRNHIQILLPQHYRNPYQGIRSEMGGQNYSLHNQRNNHPKIQQVQNQVQEGVLWDRGGIQRLFEGVYGRQVIPLPIKIPG